MPHEDYIVTTHRPINVQVGEILKRTKHARELIEKFNKEYEAYRATINERAEERRKQLEEKLKVQSLGEYYGFHAPRLVYGQDEKWPLQDQLVGVELEYENCVGVPADFNYWLRAEDGSLRLHVDGAGRPYEFKFAQPYAAVNLTAALKEMRKKLKRMKVCPTERCSTHVHMDVTYLTIHDMKQLALTYAVNEGLLFNYCDNPTKFYATAWEACQDFSFNLGSISTWHDLTTLITNRNFKYGGMNLSSIRRQRSVEFRMHPATDQMDEVERWIRILMYLIKNRDKTPNDMALVSAMGLREYVESVFEDTFQYLDCADFDNLVLTGVRLAQNMIYRNQIKEGHFQLAKELE